MTKPQIMRNSKGEQLYSVSVDDLLMGGNIPSVVVIGMAKEYHRINTESVITIAPQWDEML